MAPESFEATVAVVRRWEPFHGSASCQGNVRGPFGPCHNGAVAVIEMGGFMLRACARCIPTPKA